MVRILYWTSGRGMGHVKRANALRLGFAKSGLAVQLFIRAERSRFSSAAHRSIRPWTADHHALDAIVIDHRLRHLPPSPGFHAPVWLQLCRAGTDLEVPPSMEKKVSRISIEDCEANHRLNLPYQGCLIDAEAGAVLEEGTAREKLSELVGAPMEGRLGLSHVNTAEPEAALAFLRQAARYLEGRAETIVLSSAHREIFPALRSFDPPKDKRIVLASIDPIYHYYSAFHVLYVPCSYNTYCETQLFYHGPCFYHPVRFMDSRPRFVDQELRCREMPVVGGIGNEKIAKRILRLVHQAGSGDPPAEDMPYAH